MKLQQKNYQVESNTKPVESATFQCSMTTKAMAHAFEMQTVKLYAEPQYAAIREMVTNMIDSQRRAGNQHLPILVTLPTENDSTLTFQDKGTGMNFEDLKQCFMQFGESDKQDTNDEFGAFGWGSKSIVCLSDIAHIDSVKDGILYQCVWYMNENGLPKLDLLSKNKIDQPNGTKITVAIDKKDIQLIHAYVNRVGLFLEPGLLPTNELYKLPVHNYNTANTKQDSWTNTKKKDDWVKIEGIDALIRKDITNAHNLRYAITVDGLLYGVNAELPSGISYSRAGSSNGYYYSQAKPLKLETFAINLNPSGDKYDYPQIILPFKIGDLEFTTSRDAIKSSPENKQKIVDKLTAFADQWTAYHKHVADNSKTLTDFFNLSIYDSNPFFTYNWRLPELPVVENGKYIDLEYCKDISPRYTRTNKLLNGLLKIEVYTNGIHEVVPEVTIRQALTLPVYVILEKKREATIIPKGLSNYIVLTFKSFNSYFSLPHKLMADVWHYPELVTKQSKKSAETTTSVKKELDFAAVVRRGFLKSATLDMVKIWQYPYNYGIVITTLPEKEFYLYIDSRDNRTMDTNVINALKAFNIESIYITTPSIEGTLPDTFIKVKDFLSSKVTEITKKYGLFAEVLYGFYLTNFDSNSFELAKAIATKLRLRRELKLLCQMQVDNTLCVLKTATRIDTSLDVMYQSCTDSTSWLINRLNLDRLNLVNLLVATTIYSKMTQVEKDKAASIYEYLLKTSGLDSSLYMDATAKIIASMFK